MVDLMVEQILLSFIDCNYLIFQQKMLHLTYQMQHFLLKNTLFIEKFKQILRGPYCKLAIRFLCTRAETTMPISKSEYNGTKTKSCDTTSGEGVITPATMSKTMKI